MPSSPLTITFALYILAMVGIGFVAWRRTRSLDDYILGGRSLGSFVTAMSAGASACGGLCFSGLAGMPVPDGFSPSAVSPLRTTCCVQKSGAKGSR